VAEEMFSTIQWLMQLWVCQIRPRLCRMRTPAVSLAAAPVNPRPPSRRTDTAVARRAVQEDFEEFANPDDIYEPLLDQLEGVADTQVCPCVEPSRQRDCNEICGHNRLCITRLQSLTSRADIFALRSEHLTSPRPLMASAPERAWPHPRLGLMDALVATLQSIGILVAQQGACGQSDEPAPACCMRSWRCRMRRRAPRCRRTRRRKRRRTGSAPPRPPPRRSSPRTARSGARIANAVGGIHTAVA